MNKFLKIGVLAYHGDVIEHIQTTEQALKNLHKKGVVIPVRTKTDIVGLDALVIPGGESTVLHKLSEREGIFEEMKKIKNIFGTCAGAIMLAKTVRNKTEDQKTLKLMDITVDRNAYGRQNESFTEKVDTALGTISAVFIRAPGIQTEKTVTILAKRGKEVIACEHREPEKFYLACCFHPELTTTKFHEYFINRLILS